MIKLKSLLTSGLLTVALCLTILTVAMSGADVSPVQAENAVPAELVQVEAETVYLPLTDAPPVRDITQQRFAPLE